MTNIYQQKNTEAAAYQVREAAANTVVEQGSSSESDYEENWEYGRLSKMYLGKKAYEDADKDLLKVILRDEHFAWVDDCFARAANFPQPTPESLAITNSTAIAGEGPPSAPKEGEEPLDYLKETSGSGMYSGVAFENISSVISSLTTWQSAAGSNFKSKFLTRLTCAAANQLIAIKTLRNVAAANQAILAHASDDILKIANDTIAVLEAEDSCCGSDTDVSATLNTIAGAATVVAGIATIPLTGGASAALIAGTTTVLAGSLATYTSSGGMNKTNNAEKQLASDTVEGVLDNMRQAIETVYSSLDDANASMTKALDGLNGAIEQFPTHFIAPLSATIRDATASDIIEVVESDTD